MQESGKNSWRRARKFTRRRNLTPMTDRLKGEKTMTKHKIGSREEWLVARLELLEAEKGLTRRTDELARQRQGPPWGRIGKEYRFQAHGRSASLADLSRGPSQLLVSPLM